MKREAAAWPNGHAAARIVIWNSLIQVLRSAYHQLKRGGGTGYQTLIENFKGGDNKGAACSLY